MKTNIFNALRVSALAVVLSFGLSYALAWTAPTAIPPTGNVSAPLNTSTTPQTKAGELTVTGLNAGTGTISTTGFLSGGEVIVNKITFANNNSSMTTAPVPVAVGLVKYGGSTQATYQGTTFVSCNVPNQITGNCNCPTAYTARQIAARTYTSGGIVFSVRGSVCEAL